MLATQTPTTKNLTEHANRLAEQSCAATVHLIK